jgi:exosortase/archaeosortase family protein
MSRLTALLGVLLAGWPVLRWYGLRLCDGSDEPLGLVALTVAIFFAPRAGWLEPLPLSRIVKLSLFVTAYLVAYPFMPALLRALIFIFTIGIIAAPSGFAFGWTVLLGLSLPLISSLQFYLGYPLRVPTTQLTALLLQLFGIDAHASGTTLLWLGERMIVYAPCSGIQMAWAGSFVAATLACWLRLSWRNALRLFRWAGAIVFVANLVRSTVLFLMGAGIWRLPDFAHEGIGLLLFAGTVMLIYSQAGRYTNSSPCDL